MTNVNVFKNTFERSTRFKSKPLYRTISQTQTILFNTVRNLMKDFIHFMILITYSGLFCPGIFIVIIKYTTCIVYEDTFI